VTVFGETWSISATSAVFRYPAISSSATYNLLQTSGAKLPGRP
jgi:hypothetical protein